MASTICGIDEYPSREHCSSHKKNGPNTHTEPHRLSKVQIKPDTGWNASQRAFFVRQLAAMGEYRL
jgi:hypothetical protein